MKSKMQVPLFDLISKKLITKWLVRQLLTIMSRSIAYLTSRVNFVQVSDEIPVTKQRNPEKVDPPDVFEGSLFSFLHTRVPHPFFLSLSLTRVTPNRTANKKELVEDLMVKAKQIEYLIQSLPIPEPEEVQVRHAPACMGMSDHPFPPFFGWVV